MQRPRQRAGIRLERRSGPESTSLRPASAASVPVAVASHVSSPARASPALRASVSARRSVVEQRADVASERGRVGGEQARDPGLHGVAVAGDVGDHRGRAARRRLGDGHAPALGGRRAGEHPRAAVELDERVVGQPARHARPSRTRRGRRRAPRGARARRRRRRSSSSTVGMGAAHRGHHLDELVEALDRHQPPDGDDERRRGLLGGRVAGREARVDARAARPRRAIGSKSSSWMSSSRDDSDSVMIRLRR